MFSINDFNVDKNLIDEDLTLWIEFYNNTTSERMKKSLLREFKSVDDYIYILYWLRFYRKMGYDEIGKLIKPLSKASHNLAYTLYYGLNWNYSYNFSDVKENFVKEAQLLSGLKDKVSNENIRTLSFTVEQEYEYKNVFKHYKSIKKNKSLRKELYTNIGYYSLEDCFRAFYYLINICNLSTYQIAKIYGISHSTMTFKLKDLGLLADHETAMKNAVLFNRRNYENTLSTGRKTMSKSLLINGNIGSNSENLVRNIFASYLINYIDTETYEVIVGINNRNIIAPKEVDIPVIIINAENNHFYKFAIEFNGDTYHKDEEKDLIKKKQLEDKNWIFYSIWQYGSTKTQREKGEIEAQIKDICSNIKNVLMLSK